MLESISIQNYAIIDEMTVEFSDGLNIITGETGAGKSIVVDALELVLGARASGEMIRAGAAKLMVSGVFTDVKNLPDSFDPSDSENSTVILRREVRSDGNNRCFVNDSPVTLKVLKEIGDMLVDFHGQHDHQSLLSVMDHVQYLDGFAGLDALSGEIKMLFSDMRSIRRKIAKIERAIESAQRDRELFTFQFTEIDKAGIQVGEDDEVEASISRLSRAEELKALGLSAFQKLSEADGSIAEKLGDIAGRVESQSLYDAELAPWSNRMGELLDSVEDAARFFRNYAENMEHDPGLLADLNDRLELLERLKMKYGPKLEDVLAYRDKIKGELDGSEMSREELSRLGIELKTVESTLLAKAHELSKRRKKAAPGISDEVEHHLRELGMSGARLVVEITAANAPDRISSNGSMVAVTENGIDNVEFLIAANPGEPPKPLVKVASGGEISRIMLSLKLTLSKISGVPSMVFDEIDVGVSGRIAESIGKKLKKLTENRQALVITHLPQIAGMAKSHFSARKTVSGERTRTELVLLDYDMRQRELASLLSGDILTEAALAHAKELLDAQDSV